MRAAFYTLDQNLQQRRPDFLTVGIFEGGSKISEFTPKIDLYKAYYYSSPFKQFMVRYDIPQAVMGLPRPAMYDDILLSANPDHTNVCGQVPSADF